MVNPSKRPRRSDAIDRVADKADLLEEATPVPGDADADDYPYDPVGPGGHDR